MAIADTYNNEEEPGGTPLTSHHNTDILFRTMVNSIAYFAMAITDCNGNIISWNKGAQNTFGYTEKETIGHNIAMLYTPQAIAAGEVLNNLEQAKNYETYHTEGWRVRNNGEKFWAEVNYTLLFNEQQVLLGYAKLIKEIKSQHGGYNQQPPQPSLFAGNLSFRKLIENSYEGITLLDKNLNVFFRTASACRITGWTTSDRINSPLMELIHPDDEQHLVNVLEDVVAEPETPKTITYQVRHFNGHYIWIECIFTNFLNDPDIGAIVCNFRDITKQKRADELLLQNVRELFAYKYALDESAIVAITDRDGIIKHVNENFCNASKYSREELLGQDHRIVNSGHHDKAFMANLWTTIANGKIWKGVIKNRAKDGRFYWVDTTIIPFLDDTGKPYQYIAIRWDITARKLNEEKIVESERFTKTVTDNLPVFIAYWTADLRCLFANKPYLDWFDQYTHGIIGISKRELLGEDEFKQHEIHIQGVLQGEAQRFERTFYRSDGQSIYTDTQYLPDKDGDKIKGFYSLIYDITAVKLAEEEVNKKTFAHKQALEERNTILESIGDAFFAVDKNWTVTYWNKVAEKTLGKTKDEILNKNLWEVYPGSVGAESYKQYHLAFETNQLRHFEYYYPPLKTWYDISAYPSATGLSVYIKVINERKESENKLKELNESLQKHARELAISNAELEQFAYVASHDLQEPLRMVTSFMAQLEKKYDDVIDEKGRQYIHFAVDGAKRMRQIILDLLEFSRVGRSEDDLEDVDFNKLVHEILALYRRQIEEKQANIVFDSLPTIKTYKTPLRQVMQNLISNGLKYQQDFVEPVINISCKENKTHWQFCVRDNGIGIDPAYFDKIFIIFQRLHTKDKYSGTGMGLAITKKIIENLGGNIWVESTDGEGSAFYFTVLKK